MYITNAIGRRKTSYARVYMKKGTGVISVNYHSVEDFFKLRSYVSRLTHPLVLVNKLKQYDVVINVKGGGVSGQADACRMGISRCLVNIDKEFKPILKSFKLLTRDSRTGGKEKARKKKGS